MMRRGHRMTLTTLDRRLRRESERVISGLARATAEYIELGLQEKGFPEITKVLGLCYKLGYRDGQRVKQGRTP